jgi:hypothetical protein
MTPIEVVQQAAAQMAGSSTARKADAIFLAVGPGNDSPTYIPSPKPGYVAKPLSGTVAVGGVSGVQTALGASSEEREVGRVELEVIAVAQLRRDAAEDVIREVDHLPARVTEGVVVRLAGDLVDEPAFAGMHVTHDADVFEHLEGAVDGAEMGVWVSDLDDGGDLAGGEVTVHVLGEHRVRCRDRSCWRAPEARLSNYRRWSHPEVHAAANGSHP